MATTLKIAETRQMSWHTFTTPFSPGITAMEAVSAAKLEELVTKRPLCVLTEDGYVQELAGKYAMMAANDGSFLGIAGEGYQFLQNRELAAILDEHLTHTFPVVAAGQTPDGAGVLFVLDLGPRAVGRDDLHMYFIIAESRVVGTSLRWGVTAFRPQCLNAILSALQAATLMMNVTHNSRFRVEVESGTQFVHSVNAQLSHTISDLSVLGNFRMTEPLITDYLNRVYPAPSRAKLDAVEKRWEGDTSQYAVQKLTEARYNYEYFENRANNYRRLTAQMFEQFDTEDPMLRGSAYAAVNAVVEVQDHGVQTRGSANRGIDSILGSRADVKSRALSVALEMVAENV